MLTAPSEELKLALASGIPIAVADAWAATGQPVLPIWWIENGVCACDRGAGCPTPGKHPIARWAPHAAASATTDRGFVREVWRDLPDAGVALATGHGLVVVDEDPRHGADLTASYGLPTVTLTVRSGGGGRHRYLRTPRDLRQASLTIAPGVELKAFGSYVLTPPSLHASGDRYQVLDASAPFAWLPVAFRQVLAARRRREAITVDLALADPAEVRRVRAAAIRGPYGHKVREALERGGGVDFIDATASGHAFNVARRLIRYTDDDNVVAAVLLRSALPRPKGDTQRWLAGLIHSARHWQPPANRAPHDGTPATDDDATAVPPLHATLPPSDTPATARARSPLPNTRPPRCNSFCTRISTSGHIEGTGAGGTGVGGGGGGGGRGRRRWVAGVAGWRGGEGVRSASERGRPSFEPPCRRWAGRDVGRGQTHGRRRNPWRSLGASTWS